MQPPTRAITVWQPFAEMIMAGGKRVENRTWTTDYRGPLMIHTGQRRLAGCPQLPRSAVLGIVQLLDVHPASEDCGCLAQLGAATVDTYALPVAADAVLHHFTLARAQRVREPIPARGHEMLWRPKPELIEQVRGALVPLAAVL